MKTIIFLVISFIWYLPIAAQVLEVKANRSAIVKVAPSANAEQFSERLSSGTRVQKIGEVQRYYSIRLDDGRTGWSYKGNFIVVENQPVDSPESAITKESLLARTDVLKIVILDVEVGDATLIFAPSENGERDVLLIDTGEDDSNRIRKTLTDNGISLSNNSITRFYISHYDHDHMGVATELLSLCEIIYDHGNNNITDSYFTEVDKIGYRRQLMTLNYQETFSGNVNVECVAVNRATDFDPLINPSSSSENSNSIALIISIGDFQYFTAGDLTFKAEKSLAKGISNCDVYHVNHHGSRATSSDINFVTKLDPEVSIASNGTSYGHPTEDVAIRLKNIGSKFYQTNYNPDTRAHKVKKYIADDTYHENGEEEDQEGAKGTITVVVDSEDGKYYVIMPGLSLTDGTFDIE